MTFEVMMLEFGVRTRPPSSPWRIVVVKEMSRTLQGPVSGLPLTITHSSSWTGRLIVIRIPATAFWIIWRDENATTIPRRPSDAMKAVSSNSRKYPTFRSKVSDHAISPSFQGNPMIASGSVSLYLAIAPLLSTAGVPSRGTRLSPLSLR